PVASAPARPIGTSCPLLVLAQGLPRCSAQKSCWSGPSRVDLRRTASRHALQIRPTDRSRPANRSPAPGAAYAHADPELFAQGHTNKSFRELAAGSAGQLAGAVRVSGEGERAQDRSRLLRADDGRQSLRLLCRG